MKPIRIEEDRIIFRAVLDKGVPYVPEKMLKVVEHICKKYNRITNWHKSGGDFKECWFGIEPGFTEEEAEEIWNYGI